MGLFITLNIMIYGTSVTLSVSQMMLRVLIALIPLTLAQIMFFGWGVLINILLLCITATLVEALCLALRRRPILYNLQDYSALVSAVLLALCLPPQLPVTELILAGAFMMILGKHVFGGLGNNLFNPAMLTYAMLLLSFPIDMTSWLEPRLGVYLQDSALIKSKFFSTPLDAYSGATALDSYRTLGLQGQKVDLLSLWQVLDIQIVLPFLCLTSMSLLGGLWLLGCRVITWHIPLAMLAGILLVAGVLYSLGEGPPPWFHFIFGGAVFGAFFISTDPVSAPRSSRGRLIYGFGIGLMTMIIRTWGGYADAVAFAILFFNFAAPFIDRYTAPVVYGHGKK